MVAGSHLHMAPNARWRHGSSAQRGRLAPLPRTHLFERRGELVLLFAPGGSGDAAGRRRYSLCLEAVAARGLAAPVATLPPLVQGGGPAYRASEHEERDQGRPLAHATGHEGPLA
jgi:hypothetical protein